MFTEEVTYGLTPTFSGGVATRPTWLCAENGHGESRGEAPATARVGNGSGLAQDWGCGTGRNGQVPPKVAEPP